MKTKGLLFIIVLLFCSSIALAGIEPDELNFFPQQPQAGMMVNLGYSPAIPECSTAAASYLKPDIPVRLTEKIWFGNVTGTDKLDYLDLIAYFDALLGAVKTDAHRLSANVGGGDGMVLSQEILAQTTGLYTCLPVHGGIAMFWQVDVNGQMGWLMESIRWQNVALELHSQQANNNTPPQLNPVINIFAQNNQPASPLTVQFVPFQGQGQPLNIKPITTLSSMEAYYLTPHVYAPTEGMMGGTQLAHNDCDGTAPSYLNIGQKAVYVGNFIAQGYPQAVVEQSYHTVFTSARFNLGNHPTMPKYVGHPWNKTGLIDLSDSSEMLEELLEEYAKATDSGDNKGEGVPSLVSDDNFFKVPIPVGQPIDKVVAGPLCTRRSVTYYEQQGDLSIPYPAQELFVWWQVDLNLLGVELQNVWIAESISRISEKGLIHNYLLSPVFVLDILPNGYDTPLWFPNDVRPTLMDVQIHTTCNGILPSTLFAGSLVQPNGSALNLRTAPHGDVIGRVGTDEQLTIYGESVCWDGYRWWRTSRGGWIAESSRTAALLLPAVQRVAPPATEEAQTAPIIISTPAPTESAPPIVVTEEPTQPPRPTCDPTTGANC